MSSQPTHAQPAASGSRRTVLTVLALVAGLCLAATPRPAVASAPAPSPGAAQRGAPVDLRVLSGRADLVTGGDALVEVRVTDSADLARARLQVGSRDVTGRLVRQSPRTALAVVTGLANGANQVTASLPDGRGARLRLVNHPDTGPVISGRQIQPWICDTEGADDAVGSTQPNFLGPARGPHCETPTVTRLFYKPLVGNQFLPYDATVPDAVVATTTTQNGVTMPFIVRVEEGVQNRGIYAIATLFQPGRSWTAVRPQPQWNGKVLAQFGGGNNPGHRQGLPQTVMDEAALAKGWVVIGSGLTVFGHQDHPIVAAESLMMLQEHVAETYGPLRFTIGQGCSGGGILQDYIAGQYPGLLDGLMVQCNFPDVWTTAPEVIDCFLLTELRERDPALTDAVRASAGFQDLSSCEAWNLTFAPLLDPTTAKSCRLPEEIVYDPATNPRGVRCTMQDYASSVWGQRPRRDWGAVERQIGRGFAPFVQSNVGVLYGLKGLLRGEIDPADFVAMNAGIGGLDIDRNIVGERTGVDRGSLRTAYRTGQVTDGRQLARVPIMDLRAGANTFEVHTPVGSRILRARLDAQAGSHANHVIWTFAPSAPLIGVTPPRQVADEALAVMDRWVSRIERRGGFGSPRRVAVSRPGSLVDTCFVGVPSSVVPAPNVPVPTQVPITDQERCEALYPVFSTPRLQSGARLSNSAVACRLQPLRRNLFPVRFTREQWETLQATYPTGVCDWREPGIGERPAVPWQTYAAGPGGQPLGPAPRAVQVCVDATGCGRS